MRCSRKFPVLLVCLALAVGANAANKDEKPKDGKSKDVKKETAKKKDKAKGDAKKPSATPEPTTGDEAKPKPKLSLPLAKGYPSIDLIIPYNDDTGKKTMNFNIGVATRVDEDHVAMKKLLIETFNDETHEGEMTIDMPVSLLDLNTRVISTHDGVTIKRSDFEIVGKNMEFNTETKQGRLIGPVKMTIYNLSDEAGIKPETKPGE